MARYGAVYIFVGPPGTDLATQAEKLARRVNGSWVGPTLIVERPWLVLSWAFNTIFSRRPVAIFLPHIRPAEIPHIDIMLEKSHRKLGRVLWLQMTEPDNQADKKQWALYRSETLPAIWLWEEREVVSPIDTNDDADTAEQVWRSVCEHHSEVAIWTYWWRFTLWSGRLMRNLLRKPKGLPST